MYIQHLTQHFTRGAVLCSVEKLAKIPRQLSMMELGPYAITRKVRRKENKQKHLPTLSTFPKVDDNSLSIQPIINLVPQMDSHYTLDLFTSAMAFSGPR